MTIHTDITDTADQLTEPETVRTPLYEWRNRNRRMVGEHTVRLASLLDQLAEAMMPTNTGEGGHAAYGSKPPVRLDAASLHTTITLGAARWCWNYEIAQRDTTTGNIRALVGASASWTSDDQAALLADLRRWLRSTRIITGWQTPPYRPRAACPACDRMGTLRVGLDTRTALCLSCGAAWGPDEIGVLAEHIRQDAPALA